MPNQNYNRGIAFELKVRDLLRSVGYSASRTGGSHGIYDVVAFNGQRVYIVQCKTGNATVSNDEWNDLWMHGIAFGATPLLATKHPAGGVKFTYIDRFLKKGEKKNGEPYLPLENSGGYIRPNRGEPSEVFEVSTAGDGYASVTRFYPPGAGPGSG